MKAAEKHRDSARWLRFLEPYRRKEAAAHGHAGAAQGLANSKAPASKGKQPAR